MGEAANFDAREQDGSYRIAIRGELDMAGADDLQQALEAAEISGAGRIELGLEQLEFIDSAGLQAVLRGVRRARNAGIQLVVTGAGGHVAEMLRLSGLDTSAPIPADGRWD